MKTFVQLTSCFNKLTNDLPQFFPLFFDYAIFTLTNLTPGGKLQFTLPCDMPFVDVSYDDGRTESFPATLDTLVIEPDSMKVYMVWRAVISAPPEITTAEIRLVTNKPDC